MRRAIDHVAVAALAAATYYLLAASTRFWSGDLVPSPFWLATASVTVIALAAPARLRPAAIVGAIVGNTASGLLTFDDSLRSTIAPVLGNALELTLVVWGTTRLLGDPARIRRTNDAVLFLVIVAAACTISGLVATAGVSANVDVIDGRLESWWRWTLGNIVGEVHLTPLVLFAGSPLFFRRVRYGTPELVATVLAAAIMGAAAFATDSLVSYLLVPTALWLAIRFGPIVATAAAFSSAMAATITAGRDIGPFIEYGPNPVVDVQTFNIAVAVSAIVGGAHALRAYEVQQQVEESERRWRRLVDSAFEGIGRVDSAGVVVEANPRLCNILGLAHVDVQGRPLAELLRESDWQRLREHQDAFVGGRPSQFATWIVDRTGTRRWLEITTRPHPDGGGLFVVADDTPEHEERQHRRAVEHRLETVERDQRDQLAQDLHDGPVQELSAAIIRLSIARRTHGDHPDLAIAQDIVEQSVDHLRGTLRTLARGNVSFDGLATALDSALDRLRPGTTPRIEIEIDPDLQLDDGASRTVFDLVREATANSLVHADASSIAIAIGGDDETIRISVTDDGVGFVPHAAVDDDHLGLRLMRDRATDLGGRLDVESEPGHGTTVSVVAPRSDAGPLSTIVS